LSRRHFAFPDGGNGFAGGHNGWATDHPREGKPMRNQTVGLAIFLALTTACNRRPAAHSLALAPEADIEVTSSPSTSVIIYASKPSSFALRAATMELRSDTLRAVTPVKLTALLQGGDIYIVSAESVPIEVVADLTNAPAKRLSARGREIVIESGGAGIRPAR
jgi:hypothetical protein